MQPAYFQLQERISRAPALGVGLMSGTSVDAIDAAVVEFHGSDPLPARLLGFTEAPIEPALRERIRMAFDERNSGVDLICQLNVEIGEAFAAAALEAARAANIPMEEIHFIGSHGQTVYHIPQVDERRGWRAPSTLQLGDPCVIAARTGVTTVGDFRVRDMAAGGVGAPLIPFVDAFLFASPNRDVLCQNLGGIANCTLVARAGEIVAFDSGPANMVMDLLVERAGQGRYDKNGEMARNGRIDETALQEALRHPFFRQKPPKATGHEDFGYAIIDWLIERTPGASLADRVATACELSAHSIADAYREYIYPVAQPEEVIVSGGGALNPTLMNRLRALTPELRWRLIDEFGIPSGAKEALGFAVLACATLHGIPANVPSATGAREAVILGKIAPGHRLA